MGFGPQNITGAPASTAIGATLGGAAIFSAPLASTGNPKVDSILYWLQVIIGIGVTVLGALRGPTK